MNENKTQRNEQTCQAQIFKERFVNIWKYSDIENEEKFYDRDVPVEKGIKNSQGAPVKLAGQGKEHGAVTPHCQTA